LQIFYKTCFSRSFQAVKGVLDTVVASHIDGADTAAFSAVFGFVLDHLA
jgi:hypothetical protein